MAHRIYLSAVFFLYIVQLSFLQERTQSLLMDKLYQKLFSVYNKEFLPRLNESEPVKVSFDFVLINIKEVDSKEQTITIYGWVRQRWQNPFLRWNSSDYGGIDTMYISAEKVWVPDILLYNNVDLQDRIGGGATTYKTNVLITSNGQNIWRSPAVFKTVCAIDVTYYPFDMQTCSLKFGSWALDSQKVAMCDVHITGKSDNYVDNGEWKLMKVNSKKNVEEYAGITFDDVTITLVIAREYFNVFVNLIIPCMLISTMIFLGFILPPECGERIGLSITVLLAMTVFQQLTSSIFPSFDFPLLGQYYFATSVEISISLVATTVVLNFAARKNTKMPRWLKTLLLDWIARVVCLRKSVVRSCPKLKRMESVRTRKRSTENGAKETDQCARKDDRLVEELKNVFVITKHFDYGGLRYAQNVRSTERDNYITGVDLTSFEPPESEPEAWTEGATSRTGVLDENGEELGENELALRQWEWIIAARILDRALLWISIITGIITFFALFLRAPRFRDLLSF